MAIDQKQIYYDQSMMQVGRDRELVLPLGMFAYVLDTTKGKISVLVGPYKNSLSNTDKLVIWDGTRYKEVDDVEKAKQLFVTANEGQYIVLTNPKSNDADSHPLLGVSNDAAELDIGRKVIISGPLAFPLWPGQTANVIDGHRLRNNQYILVRVVQPQEAKINWDSSVLAPAKEMDSLEAQITDNKLEFTMGQIIVIKGTSVSYYMPSTGLEVIPDNDGKFVREAVTLERLEYCVLLSESGIKRYIHGPAVVFPEPTENFRIENGSRVFRAIELNPQSGIYVKVIAPYTENGKEYREGDELFITGNESSFYFPRPEHTIIKYGEQIKHHAIAIPSGEGRYVLNRNTGKVSLVKGPKMFLPDPRFEVIIRRVLDENTISMMYPGNSEAIAINQKIREESVRLSTSINNVASTSLATNTVSFGGDAISRSTEFTKPRTIILNTKYDGAVGVNIWSGYAVMVVDKSGNRRIELGPKNIMLEYDESLMRLELSTGKPKTDKTLYKTVYLRIINNIISDIITVETQDLLPAKITLSYRVNFVGESQDEMFKWFDVDNYVKLLTDKCRSRIRAEIKKYGVREFIDNAEKIIRDVLLDNENGRSPIFDNGMQIVDVEILDITLSKEIQDLLDNASMVALKGMISLSAAEEESKRIKRLEELSRANLIQTELTRKEKINATLENLKDESNVDKQKFAISVATANHSLNIGDLRRSDERATADQNIEIEAEKTELAIKKLRSETDMQIEKIKAIDNSLIQALQEFGDKVFVANLVEGLGPVAATTGLTTIDMFKQIFNGTPVGDVMDTLAQRPLAKKIIDKKNN